MKIELKYFSGTGNSLKIINTCADVFREHGHQMEISSITRDEEAGSLMKSELVGFCFPVYAFGIPRICRNYLINLAPFKNPAKIFILITAGEADEAGFSVEEATRILEQKGATIVYSAVVGMPSNWTVSMNPPSREEARLIIDSGVKQAQDIAREIVDGKIVQHIFNYPARWTKFGFYKDYYLFKWLGVANLWRNFRVDDSCDGCQLCSKICPTSSITMVADAPSWLNTCEQCMRCVNFCPRQAIFQKGEGSVKGKNIYHEPSFNPLKNK